MATAQRIAGDDRRRGSGELARERMLGTTEARAMFTSPWPTTWDEVEGSRRNSQSPPPLEFGSDSKKEHGRPPRETNRSYAPAGAEQACRRATRPLLVTGNIGYFQD